jgi:aspartyl-tRNA(Asn)/glutamyl-tRNA(Gln) amidotransferase subunit C
MQITHETLQKIAGLARLEILPGEEEGLLKNLEWMDQLKEIDTEGVEPLTHVTDEVNVWREDVASTGISIEKALDNAPSPVETYFGVPKVIE